jgi:hypothetical protein
MVERFLGKNWITSLAGWIGVSALLVPALPKSLGVDIEWALFLTSASAAIAGFGSKQFNVHSTREEVTTSTINESAKEIK